MESQALVKYRDVLVTIRDRVAKQKSAGRKVEDVVAAKPSAEFDAALGKGFMMPNDFVTIVYNTLSIATVRRGIEGRRVQRLAEDTAPPRFR